MTAAATLPTPTGSGSELELDGRSLTVADALAVARRARSVRLAGPAREAMGRSRALKQRLIAEEIPIYGVTTGFGDSAHRQIAPDRAAALQQNMLRFLGCGTGPVAPAEVVRVTMLLRANCLAKGNSGVRADLVDQLLALLAVDALPAIPERGSCGASGDLVPLSYVGRALVGEAPVLVDGRPVPAVEVLAGLGRDPLRLEAKEGLALTNGTSFTTAFGVLAVGGATELATVCDLLTGMASEALLGNRGHMNDFLFDAAKPHPGSVASAANVRAVLRDSRLALDSEDLFAGGMGASGFRELDRQVQDRYSIRCSPHVVGVLRDVLTWVGGWVATEINASDDNPLFDVAAGRVQSGGNFYAGHVGQAMDSLKVAVANVCDLLDRQLELLVDEKFNAGLTPNLVPRFGPDSPEAGLHHGFKGMQLCSSAMTAEALKLSAPATVHSRSTECHNQDKVSMGTIAARDARSVVELAQEVAAIHLLAVCQALELRGLDRAGALSRAAVALVRERVPALTVDRPMDGDVAAAAELIRSGRLSDLLAGTSTSG